MQLTLSRKIILACLGAIIAIGVFIHLASPTNMMPGDNYWYAYISHAMLNGEKLHTDLIDDKPPAIYATYMLAETLWGYRVEAYRNISIIFFIISSIFIFLILLRTHGEITALIGALFWAITAGLLRLQMDIPNTEFYVATFMLIALWAFIIALEDKPNWLWVAGSALAVATTYKTNSVFILLGFNIAFLLIQYRKQKRISFPIKSILQLSLPTALLWSAIILYFIFQKRFADFANIYFVSVPSYAGNIFLNAWHNFSSGEAFFAKSIKEAYVLLIVSYLWFALVLLKNPKNKLLLVYLPIFLGSMLMPNALKNASAIPYYHQHLFPLYCLTVAMFTSELASLIADKLNLKKTWPVLIVLIAFPLVLLGYSVRQNFVDATQPTFRPDDDRRLGLLLHDLTEPNESIFQWGWGVQFYFYSQRHAASGIIGDHIFYYAPLKIRQWLYPKLISDLSKSRPAFIVFEAWVCRLDQEIWMNVVKNNYQILGLYGKNIIFEKKGRALPARVRLAQLTIPTQPQSVPWENPNLVLFPGFKNTNMLNSERFYGVSPIDSGTGPEAVFVDQGFKLFQQRKHTEGIQLLAKALTINPDNLAAKAGMGFYYEATGQYSMALVNYKAVAKKIPHPFTEYYIETQNLLMQQAAMLCPPEK